MGCTLSSEKTSLLQHSTEQTSKEDTLRDARLHSYSGGSQDVHSMESRKGTNGSFLKHNEEDRVLGLEESDSGVHSRSSIASPKRSFAFDAGKPKVKSHRGTDLCNAIKQAYRLKERYTEPSKEFLSEMDKLFMDVQLYLTELSGGTANSSHEEADALVEELIGLRNIWGPRLLPLDVCNAFVRERIQLTVSDVHYRIDCAQFFEPVPIYNSATSRELVKLFRFSVYEMSRNEVVMRYYLERSNVVQLYHVLCYSHGNLRGQVHPFGKEPPSYWSLREIMLTDFCVRLKVL